MDQIKSVRRRPLFPHSERYALTDTSCVNPPTNNVFSGLILCFHPPENPRSFCKQAGKPFAEVQTFPRQFQFQLLHSFHSCVQLYNVPKNRRRPNKNACCWFHGVEPPAAVVQLRLTPNQGINTNHIVEQDNAAPVFLPSLRLFLFAFQPEKFPSTCVWGSTADQKVVTSLVLESHFLLRRSADPLPSIAFDKRSAQLWRRIIWSSCDFCISLHGRLSAWIIDYSSCSVDSFLPFLSVWCQSAHKTARPFNHWSWFINADRRGCAHPPGQGSQTQSNRRSTPKYSWGHGANRVNI